MHCQACILSVFSQFVQSAQKYQNQICKVIINDNKLSVWRWTYVNTLNGTTFKFFSNCLSQSSSNQASGQLSYRFLPYSLQENLTSGVESASRCSLREATDDNSMWKEEDRITALPTIPSLCKQHCASWQPPILSARRRWTHSAVKAAQPS